MYANVCDPNTSFDSYITVYRGDTCNQLECLDENDDHGGSCNSDPFHSGVEFDTASDEWIYLLVHGFGGDTGRFTLHAGYASSGPAGCANARELTVSSNSPVTVRGDTTNAPIIPPPETPECGGDGNYCGLWYKVRGTGQPLHVDTCDPGTVYDTYISIFAGPTCDQLVCIAFNDDHDGHGCDVDALHSGTTFETVAGEMYWIYIHGYGGSENTGDFVLNARVSTDD
jgi:hypothetical protein